MNSGSSAQKVNRPLAGRSVRCSSQMMGAPMANEIALAPAAYSSEMPNSP